MSTTIPFNGLNLSNTIGPFYWGFILSLVLTGINVVQGYLYFRSPSRDKPHTRYIAAFMIMLNLTSSALVSQSLFYYLVPHFGSLLPLNSVTNELSADCLISSIITFISQAYFAVQLYAISKLNRRKWVVVVPMTVLLCAVLTLLGGIGCAAIMVVQKHNVLDNRTLMFNAFFGVAKALGALTDIIATIAMCIMLASSKTGMNSTNEILNTLMQFTMRRGALVTTLQTSLSISFHAAPTRLYWLAFHVNVTKLYANTFFSMLNGREGLAQRGGAVIMNNDLSVGKALKLRANPANLALPLASSGSQDDVEMKLMDHTADAKGIGMTPMPTVTKT